MKRLILDKRLETCSDCIYCEYDPHYNLSYDSGYDCWHPDTEECRIVDDCNYKGSIPIPNWCPLEDIEEGDN